jgi:hypothetical protein
MSEVKKFELEEMTTVEFTDVAPRKENHGEAKVQAIDVSCKWETTQDKLAMFGPRLLTALFYSQALEAGQESVEGVPVHLPNLTMPKLEMPLKWELDLTGYTMHVDHGLGGDSNLVLANSKVNKLRITVKEGGTTIVQWMVQCNSDCNEKLVGKLCALEGCKVPIKLLAPLPGAEPIDGSKGHPGAAASKKAEEQGPTASRRIAHGRC